MQASSGHIASLDGLRAVSVMIVLISHAGFGHLIPGGFGVTVFFFLSGYLITTLLLREHARDGGISLPRFYLRRILRLTPPLFVTMLAAALLVFAGLAKGPLDPMTLFSQFFFFFNYYSLSGLAASIDGLGVLWSLSIEEHFYLFWPALFILLMRAMIGIWHVVGLIGAIFLWRCFRFLVLGSDEEAIYASTDTRLDSLLFGCLLAVMQVRQSVLCERLFAPKRLMYAVLALALVVLLFSFFYRDSVFRSTLRYSLQGLALMPIFYLAVTRSKVWVFKPLNWGPIRRIGLWSYTMYLCHFVIIKMLIAHGIATNGSAFLIVLTFVLSCVWSALVYEYAEKPLRPFRQALSGPAPQKT